MKEQKIRIINPSGMHLRLAKKVCEEARQYSSEITIMHEGNAADGKSLLSLLGACIKNGDEVKFIFKGPDEEQACDALLVLLEKEKAGEVPGEYLQ